MRCGSSRLELGVVLLASYGKRIFWAYNREYSTANHVCLAATANGS